MKRKAAYRVNARQKRYLQVFFMLLSLSSYGQLTISEGSLFSNKGLFSIGEKQIELKSPLLYDEGHWLLIGTETQNFFVKDGKLNKLTIVNKQDVQFKGILTVEKTLDVEQGNFMIAGKLQLKTSESLTERKGQLLITERGELSFESITTFKVEAYTFFLRVDGPGLSTYTYMSEGLLNPRGYYAKRSTNLIELYFLTQVKRVETPPPEDTLT